MLANRLVVLPVVEEGHLLGVLTQSEVLRGLTSGLGVGQEATRFTAKVRTDSADVYRILDVLEAHGARLLSFVRGGSDDAYTEVILRVQDVEDKEKLRAELESILRASEPA